MNETNKRYVAVKCSTPVVHWGVEYKDERYPSGYYPHPIPICGSGQNTKGSRKRSYYHKTDNPVTCPKCLRIMEQEVK